MILRKIKNIKRKIVFIGFIVFSFVVVVLFILFQVVGMISNVIATGKQTEKIQDNLESAISDVEIISVRSTTGDSSGTGNHVDCLSKVEFTTELTIDEVEAAMSEYYDLDGDRCHIETGDEGYLFVLNTSAPFSGNIAGH